MWFLKFILLSADRLVLVPVLALRIAIFLEKGNVPLTSNVGVFEQDLSKFVLVISARFDRTPKASLAPMAD